MKSIKFWPIEFNQNLRRIEGTVFFYFPGKVILFYTFGQKSDEWVKIVVFFFPLLYFFFSGNLNEWVSDMWTFPEKEKNTLKCWRKKILLQNSKNFIVRFFDLFLQISAFWQVSSLQIFPGKKNRTIFFSESGKKIHSLKSSVCEWRTNFSREKKLYLW